MEELICYCFNYTFSDIESDVKENGKSTIEKRITSHQKKRQVVVSVNQRIQKVNDALVMSAGLWTLS